MKEMTIAQAAKMLRDFAELTSINSNNWDNFEHICQDVLLSIKKHYEAKK